MLPLVYKSAVGKMFKKFYILCSPNELLAEMLHKEYKSMVREYKSLVCNRLEIREIFRKSRGTVGFVRSGGTHGKSSGYCRLIKYLKDRICGNL